MISRKEIIKRSKRHNHDENVWVHPFSGRVSSWVTWIFVNLGMSANQVTQLCALAGVASALVLAFDSFPFVIASFILFRLHVLFDVADGEVARYRSQISRFGSYWDQLMHVAVYPLILMSLVVGRLLNDASATVAILGMAGMIGKGLDLGAKNAYFRVLYSSGPSTKPASSVPVIPAPANRLKQAAGLVLHLQGFDGLLFFYCIAYLVDGSWLNLLARDWVLAMYCANFILVALIRVLLIPRRDAVPMRKDFR